MAKSTDIFYRYATAWLEAADERGVIPQIREEIDGLEKLLADSDDLRTFFLDRSLPPQAKQDFLTRIFQSKIQDITLNFLLLLVSKKRDHLLMDILEACHALFDERDQITNAEMTSAVALSSNQINILQSKLEAYTGKQIRMSASVNPDLIGGFVVHMGDTVFDSSLRVQLQRMKQALVGR